MVRVAVVAPSPLLRADLRRIVAEAADVEFACAAVSLADLRTRLLHEAHLHADVAVVDWSPREEQEPECSNALHECLAAGLRLVLLSDAEPAELLPWVGAGAAWLPAAASEAQIVAAIAASAAGLVALRAEAFAELGDELRRRAAGPGRRHVERLEPLTPRELQVLERLAAGRANRRIAQDLGISEHTAKFHVSRVLDKLDAATRAEAVAIGLREGLIDAVP